MASGSLVLHGGERKPHGWSQRKQRVSWASVPPLPVQPHPCISPNPIRPGCIYSTLVWKKPPSLPPTPPATTTLSDCITSQHAHQILRREDPEKPNSASVFSFSMSLSRTSVRLSVHSLPTIFFSLFRIDIFT